MQALYGHKMRSIGHKLRSVALSLRSVFALLRPFCALSPKNTERKLNANFALNCTQLRSVVPKLHSVVAPNVRPFSAKSANCAQSSNERNLRSFALICAQLRSVHIFAEILRSI